MRIYEYEVWQDVRGDGRVEMFLASNRNSHLGKMMWGAKLLHVFDASNWYEATTKFEEWKRTQRFWELLPAAMKYEERKKTQHRGERRRSRLWRRLMQWRNKWLLRWMLG